MSRHDLALHLSFLLKKDTTAGLGSYEAVGTSFQAMIILSFNVFWFVVVLSFEYRILYVETLLSTVMLSGEITTTADSRSLTKAVLCLKIQNKLKKYYISQLSKVTLVFSSTSYLSIYNILTV